MRSSRRKEYKTSERRETFTPMFVPQDQLQHRIPPSWTTNYSIDISRTAQDCGQGPGGMCASVGIVGTNQGTQM